MATFLLKIYHGTGYAPPAATGVFADVPVSMPLAPWIEEMARLAVTTGCGGNNFCPGNPVTRGQMAVFLAKTFHRPEAIRFLQQATWGPKDSEISGLLGVGNLSWLATQFNAPPSPYPALPLVPDDEPDDCDVYCHRDNYTTHPAPLAVLPERALPGGSAAAADAVRPPQDQRRLDEHDHPAEPGRSVHQRS